jgi:hypothetical protein
VKKLLIALVLLSGCYGQLDNIDHLLPQKQRAEHHETVDSIKRYYFTPEAYEAIKDIPAIDGVGFSPWVTGVNAWTNIFGVLTLNGAGRQAIFTESGLRKHGVYAVIHEYVHHLDDMDRDGEGEWIDHKEFEKAYKRMAREAQYFKIGRGQYIKIYSYPLIVAEIERDANYWATDIFGIGHKSEHIAHMAHLLVKKGEPDFMWRVFRKILKRR